MVLKIVVLGHWVTWWKCSEQSVTLFKNLGLVSNTIRFLRICFHICSFYALDQKLGPIHAQHNDQRISYVLICAFVCALATYAHLILIAAYNRMFLTCFKIGIKIGQMALFWFIAEAWMSFGWLRPPRDRSQPKDNLSPLWVHCIKHL